MSFSLGLRRLIARSATAKRLAQRTLASLSTFGLEPILFVQSLGRLPRFAIEAIRFRSRSHDVAIPMRVDYFHPVLSDYDADAGVANGHYFHQDLWAARRIFATRPDHHLDVGSRIDGFVAHLLVFMPVAVVDVRPLNAEIAGLQFVRGDATSLDAWADNSVMSISSLHAVEHFGLGRYGDPIDPSGSSQAMAALARILAPGGRLYFSVPIGKERIEFNTHRVFAPETILRTFRQHSLQLVAFAAVNDFGELIQGAEPSSFSMAQYSCGLFEFTK
jgi:SAM-dependent methyltransferase